MEREKTKLGFRLNKNETMSLRGMQNIWVWV